MTHETIGMVLDTATLRLPFYAPTGTFNKFIREWIDDGEVTLIQNDVECTFWLQVCYANPPVVIIGADQSLLHTGLMSRVAECRKRPLIVAITESSEEYLLSECYRQGADRVVAIPYCSVRILRALIKALLPRHHTIYPPYKLSAGTQTVSWDNKEIRLTKKAFDVAQYLFNNNGRLVPKATILEDIWGIDSKRCLTRRVETQISNLRNSLSLDGSHGWEIRMQRGKGYGVFCI